MKFRNLALIGFFLLIFLIISEGAHHKLGRFERKRQSNTLSERKEAPEAKLGAGNSNEEPSLAASTGYDSSESLSERSEGTLQNLETVPSLKTESTTNSTAKTVNLLKNTDGGNSNSSSSNEILATNASLSVPIQPSLNKADNGVNSLNLALNTNMTKTDSIPTTLGLKNKKKDSEDSTKNTTEEGSDQVNSSGNKNQSNESSDSGNSTKNTGHENSNANENNASNENTAAIATKNETAQNVSNTSDSSLAVENLNNHKFTAIKAPHNSTILRDTTNSSLELLIDKDGNKYEKVQYVQSLSPYAREELSILRDPARASSNLIGKPFYFENNMTFDETPKIFGDVINAKVWDTTRTKRDMTQFLLWKDFDGKGMSEVAFKKDNGEEEFEGNVVPRSPETAKFEDVEIKLNRTSPKTDNEADPVLDQVDNPIRKQLFDTNQKEEVTYDKNVLRGLESTVENTGAVVASQKSNNQVQRGAVVTNTSPAGASKDKL